MALSYVNKRDGVNISASEFYGSELIYLHRNLIIIIISMRFIFDAAQLILIRMEIKLTLLTMKNTFFNNKLCS